MTIAEQLAAAQAENARLTEALAAKNKGNALRCKVSEKGAISVYGLGRWPVTLYKEQFPRLLDFGDTIRQFITDNDSKLKAKGDATFVNGSAS
jgi:hypothetical protein